MTVIVRDKTQIGKLVRHLVVFHSHFWSWVPSTNSVYNNMLRSWNHLYFASFSYIIQGLPPSASFSSSSYILILLAFRFLCLVLDLVFFWTSISLAPNLFGMVMLIGWALRLVLSQVNSFVAIVGTSLYHIVDKCAQKVGSNSDIFGLRVN